MKVIPKSGNAAYRPEALFNPSKIVHAGEMQALYRQYLKEELSLKERFLYAAFEIPFLCVPLLEEVLSMEAHTFRKLSEHVLCDAQGVRYVEGSLFNTPEWQRLVTPVLEPLIEKVQGVHRRAFEASKDYSSLRATLSGSRPATPVRKVAPQQAGDDFYRDDSNPYKPPRAF